jgi:hypothetical protein
VSPDSDLGQLSPDLLVGAGQDKMANRHKTFLSFKYNRLFRGYTIALLREGGKEGRKGGGEEGRRGGGEKGRRAVVGLIKDML